MPWSNMKTMNCKYLMTSLASCLVLVAATFVAHAGQDDGPYARYVGQGLEVKWLCDGKVVRKEYPLALNARLEPVCGFPQAITVRENSVAFPAAVNFQAKKLAAISDIHGQFGNMKKLLQAHGIIDRNLSWSFGEGHLVIAGDVFDRGEQVTEALWLLYELDAQAKAAGGAVHMLLGNHEAMVMAKDLRYVNPKYLATAQLLGLSYPEIFDNQSVLGRWLRSKPVIVQVNDSLFMHAGLHPDYANLKMSFSEVNEHFRRSLGLAKSEIKQEDTLAFLYGKLGPIWYRGYFNAPLLDVSELDKLLAQMQVSRIVVGHTTMSGVLSHYKGKVISIDGDIKSGKAGEILLIENGILSRGTLDGQRLPIPEFDRRFSVFD